MQSTHDPKAISPSETSIELSIVNSPANSSVSSSDEIQTSLHPFPKSYFLCPISEEILQDPMITPYGDTFSKKAITDEIFKREECPVTKNPLAIDDLVPNHWAAHVIATAQRIKDAKLGLLLLVETNLFYQDEALLINPIVNAEGQTVESKSENPREDRYKNLFANYLINAFSENLNLSARSEISLLDDEKSSSKDEIKIEVKESDSQMKQKLIQTDDKKLPNHTITISGVIPRYIEGPDNRLSQARKYYRKHQSDCCNCCGKALCCLLSMGTMGIVAYLMYMQSQHKPDPTSFYSFEVPSSGEGKLCLTNQGAKAVSVDSLQFVMNTNLILAPWGDLFPWDATFKKKQQTDQQSYLYDINWGDTRVTLATGDTQCLTYHGQNALGPLNKVFMNPTSVVLNGEALSLLDACTECADPAPGYQVGGWYTNEGQFSVSDIPVQLVNTISINLKFDSLGNVFSTAVKADSLQLPMLALLRQKYNYLNTSITLCGYCSGELFNTMMGNQTSLIKFVNNAVAVRKQTQTDGIIINMDWWGEANCTVTPNLKGLINLLTQLKAKDSEAILQLTLPGAPNVIQQMTPETLQTLAGFVNRFLVETIYPSTTLANFVSPITVNHLDPTAANQYSVTGSVNTLLIMGINPQQLAIFVPSYGRAMNVTQMGDTYGLWQPIIGTPEVYDYRCIVLNDCRDGRTLPTNMTFISTSQNLYGNETTQEALGFSLNNQFCLTYDDLQAARLKAIYLIQNKLTGIMMLNLSGDARVESGLSLSANIHQVLSNPSNYDKPAQNKTVANTKNILNSLQAASASAWSKIMNPIKGIYHYIAHNAPTYAKEVAQELQTQMPGLLFNASVASAAVLLNASLINATSPSTINYTSPLTLT